MVRWVGQAVALIPQPQTATGGYRTRSKLCCGRMKRMDQGGPVPASPSSHGGASDWFLFRPLCSDLPVCPALLPISCMCSQRPLNQKARQQDPKLMTGPASYLRYPAGPFSFGGRSLGRCHTEQKKSGRVTSRNKDQDLNKKIDQDIHVRCAPSGMPQRESSTFSQDNSGPTRHLGRRSNGQDAGRPRLHSSHPFPHSLVCLVWQSRQQGVMLRLFWLPVHRSFFDFCLCFEH